ncbi:hypothetical protein [Azospirillum sp. SYSU D00513]|uniref:hypothetical protein n=1 Tax=Azospirillum sp. SYSU D00513 TaxID=2812561 RepID=UPI001A9564B5|nr:hypothetical protein [Azospirillum sp. SYSU D00513]
MNPTEIDLSGWILLAVRGEQYLIGHSEQTGRLLLSSALVELDPAVTPEWAVADGGVRYRLLPPGGLRETQDYRDAAALLSGSLQSWGIADEERERIMRQIFDTPQS